MDTCYLLGIQDCEERDIREHARREVSAVLAASKKHGYVLNVPIIALGEAIVQCCEEDKEFRAEEIEEWVEEHDINTPSSEVNIFKIAHQILKALPELGACDAQIAAHAIYDKDAFLLLTDDGILITNPKIQEILRTNDRKTLNIRETFRRK